MRRTGTRLIAAALLAACLVPAFADRASASWWDGLTDEKEVKLEKILKSPEAFLAVPVKFTVQFHRTNKIYNPFFTQFVPERYVNFSCWEDGKSLWVKEDYVSSHPLFFIEKHSKLAEQIVALAPFTRLKCTGTVRSTFKGEAWIEITAFEEDGTSLTNQAIGDLIAGDRLAAADRHNAAIQHYLKAAGRKDLPAPARSAVEYRLGKSYLEIAKLTEAQMHLNRAVQLDPENEDAKALLETVVARMAGGVFDEPEDDTSYLDGREKPIDDEGSDASDKEKKLSDPR